MEKEQIEEIDNLIRKRIGSSYVYKPIFNKDDEKEGYIAVYTSDIAKDIYNAGYRKIEGGTLAFKEEKPNFTNHTSDPAWN